MIIWFWKSKSIMPRKQESTTKWTMRFRSIQLCQGKCSQRLTAQATSHQRRELHLCNVCPTCFETGNILPWTIGVALKENPSQVSFGFFEAQRAQCRPKGLQKCLSRLIISCYFFTHRMLLWSHHRDYAGYWCVGFADLRWNSTALGENEASSEPSSGEYIYFMVEGLRFATQALKFPGNNCIIFLTFFQGFLVRQLVSLDKLWREGNEMTGSCQMPSLPDLPATLLGGCGGQLCLLSWRGAASRLRSSAAFHFICQDSPSYSSYESEQQK